MRRFLICLGSSPKGFTARVYPVSEECTKDEASLMEKTVLFFFVHTTETKKEIEQAYLGVKKGLIQDVRLPVTKGKKRVLDDNTCYFVGDKIELDEDKNVMGIRKIGNNLFLMPFTKTKEVKIEFVEE